MAVTTKFGTNKIIEENDYKLNRISVHSEVGDTIPLFAFYLSGILKKMRAVCNMP